MWEIEEQATKYFKSKNRFITKIKKEQVKILNCKTKSLNLKYIPPKKKWENLNKPNEPIFSIKLAKIMEPDPEALTWALVSQKWRNITGSLEHKINKKKNNKTYL